MAPSCTSTLHGPSRLSRASCGMPPLAVDDAHATLYTDEEFQALMRGECEMLSVSDDELQSPRPFGNDARFQAPLFSEEAARFNAPGFSIDDLLQAPLSEDDAKMLAHLFCDEEIDAILAAQPRKPRSGGQAAKKRKRPPPSRSSSDDAEPPPVPRRPAKRARKKIKRAQLLRAWHKEIAARILKRQSRAPEPSGGRTALRCQCAEIAAADDHRSRGCALHQDTREGGEWTHALRSRVPLAAGPGEVLVPTLSAGDSIMTVTQYGRWRRSAWMPTRFYLQHAAERSMAEQLHDGWMMDD